MESRFDLTFPPNYISRPNRKAQPYWQDPYVVRQSQYPAFLAWGATKAKGARAAYQVPGERCHYAAEPNLQGQLAHRQADLDTGAFTSNHYHWFVPTTQPIAPVYVHNESEPTLQRVSRLIL